MTNKELNNDFSFIKELKGSEIKENKVYLPFIDNNSNYFIITSIITIISTCIYIFLGLALFVGVLKFIDLYREFFVKNKIWMISLLSSVFFIPPIIFVYIFKKLFSSYKVIDFEKGIFYTKQHIFGITSTFDFIRFENVTIICNNVLPQETLPFVSGKKNDIRQIGVNPNTKYFHSYYLSFLLKDGTLINYIKLGYSGTSYELSIKLAEKLSKYLNTELEVCEDYCRFRAKQIGDESNPVFKLKKRKITEKDLIADVNPEYFIFFVSIFFIAILFIVINAFINSVTK